MNSRQLTEEFNTLFPFWNQLNEEEKNYICENSVATTYAPLENIHNGTECTGIILVSRGSLRVYMLSEEGKEVTLFRLGQGEMCTLSASCILETITFDVFIDAEEESDCIIISAPAYTYISEKHPDARIFALETTVSSFSEVMWAMQQMLFMNIERRLAIFLLDESGKKATDTITLTHEQIAKYMGSAREVVSRTLKNFAKRGLVEVSRKGVKIINKKALRNLAL